VNIPEFVNIPPDGLTKISVPAAESYRLFDVALKLTTEGQFEAAIAGWNKVLELDPANAKAHSNLGVVLVHQGRLDEGITHYRKAVEVDPEYGEAQNNLGVGLLRRGSLDDAITHLQKALEVNPDYARTDEAILADFNALASPLPAKLRFEDVGRPTGQDEVRSLDAQHWRSLDTVMGCIVASGDPLRRTSRIQREGWPNRPNAGAGYPDGSGGPNLSANLELPGSECPEIDKLIADLEIPRLRKLTEQKKDTVEGVAAQRQILRIFLHTFEAGSQLLEHKRYAQAVMCFEIAAQAAPNNPYIFYDLARVLALNNQKGKALQTLEMAAEKGFNNFDQLEGDRAFEDLREDSGYREAIGKMRGAKPPTEVAP
jgi:tetratricopeptide (TPR) repeat protein